MSRIDHWPMWLQTVAMLPFVACVCVQVWILWPTTKREWLLSLASLAYMILFYFIFIR
jgi:hypothetical protein